MLNLTSHPPTSLSQSAQPRKAERLLRPKGNGQQVCVGAPFKKGDSFSSLQSAPAEWRPSSLDHWEPMCGRSIYRNHCMASYNLKLELKGRPDVMAQASNPRLGSEGSQGYKAVPNMPGFVSKHDKQISGVSRFFSVLPGHTELYAQGVPSQVCCSSSWTRTAAPSLYLQPQELLPLSTYPGPHVKGRSALHGIRQWSPEIVRGVPHTDDNWRTPG